MLRISKLTDYAIVVMTTIATQDVSRLSARDIAKSTQIAEPTVSKLLKILAREGLLDSHRGTQGGYQLIRAAKDIKLTEVIHCIDGNIALTECDKAEGCCSVATHCHIGSNWRKISHSIRLLLGKISLADMLQPDFNPEHFIKQTP